MNAAPTEADVLRDLAAILAEDLGLRDSGPIGRGTRFFADLGLASIDAVVLAESVQRRFGRPLPFDALMADLGSRADRDLEMGELVDFVRRHLARP